MRARTEALDEKKLPPTICEGLKLRNAAFAVAPAEGADDAFLQTLMRDECEDAYASMNPPRELLDRLIRSQRLGEADRIRRQFPAVEFLVIRRKGDPIGRLVVAHEVTEFGSCLRLADMAILRFHQSRGYGGAILRDLVDSARRMGFYRINVTVFAANDVFIRLLKQVGFRIVGTLDPTGRTSLIFPLP